MLKIYFKGHLQYYIPCIYHQLYLPLMKLQDQLFLPGGLLLYKTQMHYPCCIKYIMTRYRISPIHDTLTCHITSINFSVFKRDERVQE